MNFVDFFAFFYDLFTTIMDLISANKPLKMVIQSDSSSADYHSHDSNTDSSSGTESTGVQVSEAGVNNMDNHNQNAESVDDNQIGGVHPDTEFVAPSPELAEKIVKQVEFYFSDANIVKDEFLLRHIKQNKSGFVSLKVICSFPKIKCLTKDFRQVASSLQHLSSALQVNDAGTKVCRKDPIPKYDPRIPLRTVVVSNLNLPSGRSIDTITKMFESYGNVVLVRLLKPGVVPRDVQPFLSNHIDIGRSLTALVEFDSEEAAEKALKHCNVDNWRTAMRVALLSSKRTKPKRNDGDNHTPHNASNAARLTMVSQTGRPVYPVGLQQERMDAGRNGCTDVPCIRKSVVIIRQPRGPEGKGFFPRTPV